MTTALAARASAWVAGALVLCAWHGCAAPAALARGVPPLEGRVNDLAELLPADRARQLDARLAEHERRTGQQFALLTLPSLEGQSIEQLGIEVAEKWKLGDARRDDGLILIVARAERELRIEVGYGLEGSIPDAIAARVIREVIVPAFARGDYPGGIEAGFSALIERAGGAPAPRDAPSASNKRERLRGGAMAAFLLAFLLMGVIRAFVVGIAGSGYRRYGRDRHRMFGGGLGAGLGGGFGGGGFRLGGGGGGGFRGGGGGFGGGGASGRW